jgi:O-acetyl-ADP-ribose deacetylase (regulator of RNase III)
MIRYTQGNLLEASADALVNTVNEVGVMGKGIALQFREAFQENNRIYEQACRNRQLQVGRVLITRHDSLLGPRWIINFPTKKHWRFPSRMEWIRAGLDDLARVIREYEIKSIALPPLGCGNGGLQWPHVRSEIEARLGSLEDVDILVFAPTEQYYNTPKRAGLEALTPARALIAELARRYAVLGLECTNLELQKLAWFLTRTLRRLGLQDELDLQFAANKYGPYADRLRHLLDNLDGSYLHCEKRLSDAGPFDLIWFEYAKREALADYLASESAQVFIPALDEATRIIDGFESPLGMELLATVDWLITREECEPTAVSVKAGIAHWPGGRTAGRRKLKQFNDRLLELALARLSEFPITSPHGDYEASASISTSAA